MYKMAREEREREEREGGPMKTFTKLVLKVGQNGVNWMARQLRWVG